VVVIVIDPLSVAGQQRPTIRESVDRKAPAVGPKEIENDNDDDDEDDLEALAYRLSRR
jgi:hypothetical protein